MSQRSILFLTRAMTYGGAQRQLSLLARGLQRKGWRVGVAVFYGGGPLEAELRAEGVEIFDLRKSGRWDMLGFVLRLIKLLRAFQPDILHSYLTGPNVVAGLAGFAAPSSKLVWGFRASLMDMYAYDFAARLSNRLQRMLASRPDLIISNSDRGREDAVGAGYQAERLIVIANGIDTNRFQPDPKGRERIRCEQGIDEAVVLIGCIARLDPKKDHETLLRAYALYRADNPNSQLMLVGDDVNNRRAELAELTSTLGISDSVIFVGAKSELAAWYSALDIHCLASRFGEGFPNVIGEAMACGTVCVATNCGDAEMIVEDAKQIAPVYSPQKLAECLRYAQAIRSPAQSQAVRQRIIKYFSTEHLIDSSATTLSSLLDP